MVDDPHNDRHVQEGYVNEDGEFIPGKISHHIEGGRLPPVKDMISAQSARKAKFSFVDKNNPFAGLMPKNSLAIDAFKAGAEQGIYPPLVTPDDAKEMTKRFSTGLGKFDRKKFKTFIQRIKAGEEEADPMSSVRRAGRIMPPTDEEALELKDEKRLERVDQFPLNHNRVLTILGRAKTA